MIVSKATKTQVLMAGAGIVAFLGGLFCFALSSRPYLYERLITFLNPYRDPQGSGYQLVQSIASMRQAGLWGQGFGAPNQVVPYVYSDFIFTYIVYALGWVVGAALLLVVAFFIIRMIQAARRVKDPYGMLVISGTASIFSVQFVWAILMTMGFVPVAGTSLPFISYGGSQFVLQMAAMGLILSIYRRKDIRRRNTV
jgi:cell division protein FtsW (lipid II flippase)